MTRMIRSTSSESLEYLITLRSLMVLMPLVMDAHLIPTKTGVTLSNFQMIFAHVAEGQEAAQAQDQILLVVLCLLLVVDQFQIAAADQQAFHSLVAHQSLLLRVEADLNQLAIADLSLAQEVFLLAGQDQLHNQHQEAIAVHQGQLHLVDQDLQVDLQVDQQVSQEVILQVVQLVAA